MRRQWTDEEKEHLCQALEETVVAWQKREAHDTSFWLEAHYYDRDEFIEDMAIELLLHTRPDVATGCNCCLDEELEICDCCLAPLDIL